MEDDRQPFLLLGETNERYPVSVPSCTLGSDESNNIVLKHPYPEPIQISIRQENDKYYARVESGPFKAKVTVVFGIFPVSTWTTINGKPLKTSMQLQDGDCLKVGENIYWFVLAVPNPSPAPARDSNSSERED